MPKQSSLSVTSIVEPVFPIEIALLVVCHLPLPTYRYDELYNAASVINVKYSTLDVQCTTIRLLQ